MSHIWHIYWVIQLLLDSASTSTGCTSTSTTSLLPLQLLYILGTARDKHTAARGTAVCVAAGRPRSARHRRARRAVQNERAPRAPRLAAACRVRLKRHESPRARVRGHRARAEYPGGGARIPPLVPERVGRRTSGSTAPAPAARFLDSRSIAWRGEMKEDRRERTHLMKPPIEPPARGVAREDDSVGAGVVRLVPGEERETGEDENACVTPLLHSTPLRVSNEHKELQRRQAEGEE
ncbi:hypothetical protein FB451DRAFT_1524426 [Mycena latifolia]|nr:hypothetical protein FB451DRAFT_1524426 [Mycena latifolia]